jgi:hypothetical protein
VWYFGELNYVNIKTDICWDAMHVLKNWGDYLLSILLNKKCKSKFIKEYLKLGGYHKWNSSHPWVLTNHDQITIDCLLECIVIPKGYKKEFDVKKICSQKCYIKSAGYITLLTALFPFLLSYTSLPKAYIIFFRMLADDFTDLLSVECDDSYCEELFNRLKELLGVKEGLFPDSECQLIYHQLICLKSSIKCFGALKHTWAFSGERCIHSLKKICKTGYEQNNLKDYDSFEANRINYFYNFSLDNIYSSKDINDKNKIDVIDGTIVYNDKICFISSKEKNILKLNDFQVNHLLHAVVLHVYKQARYNIERAKKNSRIFFLYCVYLEIKEVKDFVYFMYACVKYAKGHPDTAYDFLVHALLDKKEKFYNDYLRGIDYVMSLFMYITSYRFASVNGIKFKSRGREYCESSEPKEINKRYGAEQNYKVYLPANELNALNQTWMNKESTWSKLRNTIDISHMAKLITKRMKNTETKETFRYVQNNYYFCLNLKNKGEYYVDHTMFANVTSWNTSNNKIFCKEMYKNKKQIPLYDIDNVFAPLSNYCSTAVAFCAFGDNKPYNIQLSKDKFCLENSNFFCNKENKEADYLYMIDIHPERRNIR